MESFCSAVLLCFPSCYSMHYFFWSTFVSCLFFPQIVVLSLSILGFHFHWEFLSTIKLSHVTNFSMKSVAALKMSARGVTFLSVLQYGFLCLIRKPRNLKKKKKSFLKKIKKKKSCSSLDLPSNLSCKRALGSLHSSRTSPNDQDK